MNDDFRVNGDVAEWQELTAEPDRLIDTLAEAARRHGVMVSITVSPYESEVASDDDQLG